MEVEEVKSAITVTCEVDEARQVIKRVHEVTYDGRTFLLVVKVSKGELVKFLTEYLILICLIGERSRTLQLLS